jgi:two-component system phosphate regulon sensor histidine kinase PhoR
MVRTIAKISLVLLIIVALPMGVYLVREYSALSKNEEMVERVFSTQLESILYSINQYSENVVFQWSQTLDLPVDAQGELMQGLVDNLFRGNQSIRAVRFLDLETRQVEASYFSTDEFVVGAWPSEKEVETLRGYLKENYQRLETERLNGNLLLYFLPKNRNGNQACQIVVDLQTFIQQNLNPQIQQVAQDLFDVNITDSISGGTVYGTAETGEMKGTIEKAAMWYLPGYQLGIRLKNKTVQELASERTQRDNLVLMGMGLLVVMGFAFVLFNIRKEMKLAGLKSEFVSNVSHEIRTPLALISMYAETLVLKRVKTEEKQQEYLKTIQQESVRLTDIVNRILNFSRIEKNKIRYRFEEIDLKEVVPEAMAEACSYLDSAHVDCRFSPDAADALVVADYASVKTMVGNLIDNAIKYSAAADKKIDIRLLKKQKQVWLEVEDNGIGISTKHQKYIFDQFYRVTEGDLAHKAKGSGLGLNLVKRLMKAHGGDVSVRSKLGEGSTFILKFPVKKQHHV